MNVVLAGTSGSPKARDGAAPSGAARGYKEAVACAIASDGSVGCDDPGVVIDDAR